MGTIKIIITKTKDVWQNNDLRYFCYEKEWCVHKDCLIWKQMLENEVHNPKPKVQVNVALIEWDPLVIENYVTASN